MMTVAMNTPAIPARHPPEELLLDCATGALSAAEALLIGQHAARCPACRRALALLEATGGSLLNAAEPAWLPPAMLNRMLAAIERRGAQAGAPESSAAARSPSGAWRAIPGGYGMRRIACDDDTGRVWLIKAPGGKGLLRHRHVGDEWTVVVKGAFIDETGRYAAGDFVRLDDGVEHQPMAERGEDCVCLILIRKAPRYTTVIGKLAAPFLRV
jgi:putative transcriptional regulator